MQLRHLQSFAALVGANARCGASWQLETKRETVRSRGARPLGQREYRSLAPGNDVQSCLQRRPSYRVIGTSTCSSQGCLMAIGRLI